MTSEETRAISDNYVESYNSFDVESMVKHLEKDILFKNFSNDEINTETRGIQELKYWQKNRQKFSLVIVRQLPITVL